MASSIVYSGQGTVMVPFDQVKRYELTLTPVQNSAVNFTKSVTVNVLKKRPYIVDSQWLYQQQAYVPQLQLTFSEAVTFPEGTDVNQLLNVSAQNQAQLIIDSVTLDQQQVSVSFSSPLALGTTFNVDTSTSALIGASELDNVFVHNLSMRTPQVFMADLAGGYQIEGQVLDLQTYLTASISRLSNSDIQWSTGHTTAINLGGHLSTVNVPWVFASGEFTEGDDVSLEFSAYYLTEVVAEFAKPVTVKLLTADSDYDGDGINNLTEHLSGVLNPLLSDTDGNGILDGEDDHDQDGLSNQAELEFGTDITISDTDNDGLNDALEFQLGTVAVGDAGDDSDNDGVPDFVEYMSLSNPNDINDYAIDPFYISEINIVSDSVSFELKGQEINYSPEVLIHFESGDFNRWLNANAITGLFIFASSDPVVAAVNLADESVRILAQGSSELTVSLLENPVLSDTQTINVTSTNNGEATLTFMDIGLPQKLFLNTDNNVLYLDIPADYGVTINSVRLNGEFVAMDTEMGTDPLDCAYSDDDDYGEARFSEGEGDFEGELAQPRADRPGTWDLIECSAGIFSYSHVYYRYGMLSGSFKEMMNDHRMVLFIQEALEDNLTEVLLEVELDLGDDETKTLSLTVPVVANMNVQVSDQPGDGYLPATGGLYIQNDDLDDLELGLTLAGQPLQSQYSDNFNANGIDEIEVESNFVTRFYGFDLLQTVEGESALMMLATDQDEDCQTAATWLKSR